MPLKIQLAIADDEELFRVGLSHILARDSEVEIIFQASNGQELLDYLATAEDLPDIVITDIKMPELNGVEATKIIIKDYPEVPVIALTTYNTRPFIKNMIEVGASAYLVKNSPPSQVIHTIKQVFYKGFHYDNETIDYINKNATIKERDRTKTVFDDGFITTREKEVLEHICKQLNSPEIAEKLHISSRTVEVHRKNLFAKTNSKNVAGLVIFAINNGLVPPLISEE